MKKKILFSYPEMMIGGSTTSLLSLLHTIDFNRYEVDLILYRNKGEFFKDIPEQVNVLKEANIQHKFPVFSIIKKIYISIFKGYLFKSIYYNFKFFKKLSLNSQILCYAQVEFSRKIEMRYDIAIGYLENWANGFVLKKVNANKKIIWIHVDYKNANLIPKIDRKQFYKADIIVCVSKECLSNFNDLFPEYSSKTICFENILSSKLIENKSKQVNISLDDKFDGLKIITVCRLSIYHKGLDRAISVMKILNEEGFNFKWYIIGDGSDRNEVEKLINEANLTEKILLLGNKVNPYPYYHKCDLFLMPSRYEGKPMAVTEAQILGIPVVATRYSSAEEQISHNKDGLIVNNDENGIYSGIKTILDNRDLIENFKNNLKNRNLSNEYIINQFYNFIE